MSKSKFNLRIVTQFRVFYLRKRLSMIYIYIDLKKGSILKHFIKKINTTLDLLIKT